MREITPLVLPNDTKETLASYLISKFSHSLKARKDAVDNHYRRWEENYLAKPKVAIRTTPFYNASNFVPQLIRMSTDIMHARLMGLLFAPKPFMKPRFLTPDSIITRKHMDALARWFETVVFRGLDLFQAVDLTLHTTVKTGTCLLKAPYVRDPIWVGGALEGANEGKEIKRAGMKLYPVDYDDFWPYPVTAQTLKDVSILFHRVRLTKEEVEYRKASRDYNWNEKACDALLMSPSQPASNPAREAVARGAGIDLSIDVTRPYNVIEAWLSYPITNDASKRYAIVCTFNPLGTGENTILRGIYNPYDTGENCFVDFRINHRSGLFFGTGLAEVLEQSQEEQAQIHNSRRDSNTISNIPGWKKKKYAGVPNPATEWYPSKVFELEHMDDLEPLVFGINYNSMVEEETFVLNLADRYSAVTTPMQGMGAGQLEGKRGIYNTGGTLALISEGNRRLDLYIHRLRYPFHRLGTIAFDTHYNLPEATSKLASMGDSGQLIKQVFELHKSTKEFELFFDIGASDASANKETDRSALLLMANTMASYYRQVVEAASIVAQMPDQKHPLAQLLLQVLDSARDLSDRILNAYDIGDRDALLIDTRTVLGGSPEEGAEYAESKGMPEPKEDVSIGGLQALSERLTALKGSSVV